MDLDRDGWPQLPTPGIYLKFRGGGILLQVLGVCQVISAYHTANAAGRPGGRVVLETDTGEVVEVTLSNVREHAEIVTSPDAIERFKKHRPSGGTE